MVETSISARSRFRGDDARAAKVYQGVIPLTPDDIAEAILWAASRPAHVNIAHVLMTSITQANSLMFHREQTGTTGSTRCEDMASTEFFQISAAIYDAGEQVPARR